VSRLEKVVGDFKGQFAPSSETAPAPAGSAPAPAGSAASVSESAQSSAPSGDSDGDATPPPANPPTPTGGSDQ
jgi:hypothetical protein